MNPIFPMDADDLIPATFLQRPNRFIVRVMLSDGRMEDAYMPNPGRMRELLLPKARLLLTRRPENTRPLVVAIEQKGKPILLHTHWNNLVARALIEERRIPELKSAHILRAEARCGRSRFDFLLEEQGKNRWLEVKSCTLFGNRVAMFPDAVTDRGRRHLEELADLAREGASCTVLFLVHSTEVDWFMPDYHTDPAFARTLLEVRNAVQILPIALDWQSGMCLGDRVRTLPIPWEHIDRETQDRGAYWLLLHLPEARRISVGALGACDFPAGWYIYVGSAMKGLQARIDHHLRRRKQFHWHIDYLRAEAATVQALPIRSSARIECPLADALSKILSPAQPGFGCSDCSCPTHLFYHPSSPLDLPEIHDLLARFRMRHP